MTKQELYSIITVLNFDQSEVVILFAPDFIPIENKSQVAELYLIVGRTA